MKNTIKGVLMILLVVAIAGIIEASLTYDQDYYVANRRTILSGGSNDPLYQFIGEVEDLLEGTTAVDSLYLDPTNVAPTAVEGAIYASDADNALKYYTGTAWVDIDVSGASSLATAYTAGSKILAPTLAVEIEVADGSNNGALLLDSDDTSDNIDVLAITNAGDDGAAASIQIDGTAGFDIQGTGDVWNVSYQGLGVLVGLIVGAEDLELENGGEIQNVVDTEIRFMENSEDFILDFTTDGITLKSGTGVVAIDFGDVDALTGINAIAFDAAVANTITQTGTGDTDDLTISQAGTADVSLILSSAGSITDALSLITTDAVGVIKISSSDVLDIDTIDDIDIDTSDGTYTLTIGGGADGDYVCTVADNFSTIVVGTLLLQNTEATSDIKINSILGSILIEAEEDAANAILIVADGSTASTLEIFNDTGTSTTEKAASIQLLSDVGSIELWSGLDAADAVNIMVDGSTASGILLFNDTGTAAAAATESDASIQLLSDLGGIGLRTSLNAVDAIRLETDGGTSEGIIIHSNQGTSATEGAASIQLLSDVGGISIKSGLDGSAITLVADAGTSEVILINADQGTGVDSITIDSDDGGITFNTGTGANDCITYNGRTDSLIVIEGTADGFETSLIFTDPSADGTLTFPDTADEGAAGGEVAWIADGGTTTKDATDAALPVTDAVVIGTSDATSSWSLPNGEEGQILTVVIGTDGGEATITPDTAAGCGWATVVLTSDIDGVTFMYVDDTIGWIIIGTFSDGTNLVEVTQ